MPAHRPLRRFLRLCRRFALWGSQFLSDPNRWLGADRPLWKRRVLSDVDRLETRLAMTAVNLTGSTYSVIEDKRYVEIGVALTAPVYTADVTVSLSATAGTAKADDDFSIPTSTVTIPKGLTLGYWKLWVNDDAASESSESLTVTITGATGGVALGTVTLSGTVTISDPTTLGWTPGTYAPKTDPGQGTLLDGWVKSQIDPLTGGYRTSVDLDPGVVIGNGVSAGDLDAGFFPRGSGTPAFGGAVALDPGTLPGATGGMIGAGDVDPGFAVPGSKVAGSATATLRPVMGPTLDLQTGPFGGSGSNSTAVQYDFYRYPPGTGNRGPGGSFLGGIAGLPGGFGLGGFDTSTFLPPNPQAGLPGGTASGSVWTLPGVPTDLSGLGLLPSGAAGSSAGSAWYALAGAGAGGVALPGISSPAAGAGGGVGTLALGGGSAGVSGVTGTGDDGFFVGGKLPQWTLPSGATAGTALTPSVLTPILNDRAPDPRTVDPHFAPGGPSAYDPKVLLPGYPVQPLGALAGGVWQDGPASPQWTGRDYDNGGPLVLNYDSNAVDLRPVVGVRFPTQVGTALPTAWDFKIKFDGGAWQTPRTGIAPVAGSNPGDTFVLADQAATAITTGGRHTWTVDVTAKFADAGDVHRVYDGFVDLAPRNDSPFGPGWNLTGYDRLWPIKSGGTLVAVMLESGSGGTRTFDFKSGGYVSPANDPGTLTTNTAGDYVYTTPQKWTWVFDKTTGMLEQRIGPDLRTTTYTLSTHSGSTDLIIEMPDGHTTATFQGDTTGFFGKVLLPDSRVTSFTRDVPGGDLRAVTLPSPVGFGVGPTFTYDTDEAHPHRITVEDWGLPQPATATYDDTGFDLSRHYNGFDGVKETDEGFNIHVVPQTQFPILSKTAPRDADIVAVLTDGEGHLTTITLDDLGRLKVSKTPDGAVNTFLRAANGVVTTWVDPLDRRTSYGYDTIGLSQNPDSIGFDLTHLKRPDDSTFDYTYDSGFFRPSTAKDPRGNLTTFTRDPSSGAITQIARPDLQYITYAWDKGLLTGIQESPRRTTFQFDPTTGQLGTVTWGAGGATTWDVKYKYGPLDTVTLEQAVTIQANGATTTVVYDGLHQVHTIAAPDLGPVTAPLVGTSIYDYNLLGQLTGTTLPSGRQTGNRYDGSGWPTAQVDISSSSTPLVTATVDFDQVGRAQIIRTPAGTAVSLAYDYDDGRSVDPGFAPWPARAQSPDGSMMTYAYDDYGRLTGRAQPGGGGGIKLLTYTLDPLGRPTKVENTNWNVTYTFDAAGLITGATGVDTTLGMATHAFQRITFGYDALGLPQTMVRPAVDEGVTATVTTMFDYDRFGRPTGVLAGDVATSILYDDTLPQIKIVRAPGVGIRLTETLDYDPLGHLTGHTLPGAATMDVKYDAGGRVISQTVGAGTASPMVYTYTYDFEHLHSLIRPGGGIVSFGYDGAGRVDVVDEAAVVGGITTLLQHTTYSYDALTHALNGVSNTAGASYAWDYNALGQLVSITDPLGHPVTLQYDPAGHLGTVTWADNRTVSLLYDLENRLIRRVDTDAFGVPLQTLSYDYRDDLRLIRATGDGLGEWQYGFDAAGQLAVIGHGDFGTVTALHATTSLLYDGGRLTGVVDPLGHRTTLAYDLLGRLVAVTDATNLTTTAVYDGNADLQAIVDPLLHRTTFGYDALHHLINRVDAAGSTTTWDYGTVGFDRGLVVRQTLPEGEVTAYGHDPLGRLLWQTDAWGTGLARTHTYGYDPAGLLALDRGPLGVTTSYGYDATGNLRTQARGDGTTTLTQSYEYGVQGWLLAERTPAGVTTAYVRDGLGRVTALGVGGLRTTTYEYGPGSLLLGRTDADGFATTYAYDVLDRTTGETDGAGTAWARTLAWQYEGAGTRVAVSIDGVGARTSFSYDKAGRMLRVDRPLGAWATYLYDGAGRLQNQTDEAGAVTAYGYDNAGRRTVVVEDVAGLHVATTTAYDGDGRVTSVTMPSRWVTGGYNTHATTYSYDALHRLLAATESGDSLLRTTTYSYDALNRLVSVRPQGGVPTTTSYDALGRVAVRASGAGGALATLTTYTDGDGRTVGGIDARGVHTSLGYDGAGRWAWATADAGGSLARTTSTSYGTVVVGGQTYSYDQTDTAYAGTSTVLYDALGRSAVDIDALERRTTMVYDGADQATQVTEPGGGLTTYSYDALGRLTGTTDAVSRRATYGYDLTNRRDWMTDERGSRTTTQYDPLGRVLAVANGLGTTAYERDPLGRAVTITDALGTSTTLHYDGLGRQDAATEAANVSGLRRTTTFTYDLADRLTATTDALSQVTSYGYDGLGRRVAVTEAATDTTGLRRTTTVQYDAGGLATVTINALGGRTTTSYDALGRETLWRDELDRRTTTAYDDAARTVAVTDPLTHATTVAYDLLGRAVAVTDPLVRTTAYAYDDAGNLQAVTDPLNHAVTYSYDAVGRPVSTEDALNRRSTWSYDAAGLWAAWTNPRGFQGTVSFDAYGRTVAEAQPNGGLTTSSYTAGTTTYAYDALGRLVGATDPVGAKATYGYDALSRQVRADLPDGVGVTTSYDALDRVTGTVDNLSARTTTLYDVLGRVRETRDALNHPTTVGYDALDRMTWLKDPNGNRTTFSYDAAGQMLWQQDATGAKTTYTYDAAGQLQTRTDPLGRVKQYGYDAAGELTGVVWKARATPFAALATVQLFTYAYDATGHQTVAANAAGAYTLAYDAGGQVVRVDGLWNTVLTFSYDAAGNRTSVEDNFGGVMTSTYDAGNALATRAWTLGSTARSGVWTASGRDAAGRLTAATRQDGDASAGLTAAGTSSVTYTPGGQVATLKHTVPSGGSTTTLAAFTYTYDAADRLKTQTRDGALQTYSYDATGQLSAVAASGGTTSYGYDAGGNRTSAGSQTATYTTANRLVTSGSSNLGYTQDAAGSVVEAKGADPLGTMIGDYAAERAGYDLDGRLAWVERVRGSEDEGGGGPGSGDTNSVGGGGETDDVGGRESTTLRVDYQYDAWGNMVGRSVTEYTGGTAGTPAVEKYAVDGWEVAQDFWGQRPGRVANEAVDKWADVTAEGTLLARRVSGDGVDDLVAGYSSTLPGGHVWYLQDRLGSVVGEASGAGGNSTAGYGAWGAVASGSVLADRYGWTGREHDAAAGLIDLRDRHYEAATGRFWQEDPSGLSAGDSNLYRFAGNSPTNGTDPSGHEWVSWDGFKRGMGFLGNGAAMIVTAPKDAAAALAGAVLLSDTNVPTNEMLAIVRDNDSSLRSGAVTGLQDGVIMEANGMMGGLHPGVRQEAERLKAENGTAYEVTESAGRFYRNVVVFAATSGVAQGVGVSSTAVATTTLAGTAATGGVNAVRQRAEIADGSRDHFSGLEVFDSATTGGAVSPLAAVEGAMQALAPVAGVMGVQAVASDVAAGHWWTAGVDAATTLVAVFAGRDPKTSGTKAAASGGGEPVTEVPGRAPTSEAPVPNKPTPVEGPPAHEGPVKTPNGGRVDVIADPTPEPVKPPEVQTSAPANGGGGCFAAGVPMRVPGGWKPVEALVRGDRVLSRPEGRPEAAVEERVVEEVFVQMGLTLRLRAGGQVIEATAEHPLFCVGKGWVPLFTLAAGDCLATEVGGWVEVEGIDEGRVTTVYNVRVAEHHTYFVGCADWGFSVWAHNIDCAVVRPLNATEQAGTAGLTDSAGQPLTHAAEFNRTDGTRGIKFFASEAEAETFVVGQRGRLAAADPALSRPTPIKPGSGDHVTPANADELTALNQAQGINAGRQGIGGHSEIITNRGPLGDPIYAADAYQKWEYETMVNGNRIVVHYVKNDTTGAIGHWKIKK